MFSITERVPANHRKEQLGIALGGSQGHTQSWQNFLEHGATCMIHLGGQQLYGRTI